MNPEPSLVSLLPHAVSQVIHSGSLTLRQQSGRLTCPRPGGRSNIVIDNQLHTVSLRSLIQVIERESPRKSTVVCADGGCGAVLIPALGIFPVYFPQLPVNRYLPSGTVIPNRAPLPVYCSLVIVIPVMARISRERKKSETHVLPSRSHFQTGFMVIIVFPDFRSSS